MELSNQSETVLSVNDLFFKYSGAEKNVLNGISLEFRAGEKTAILGSNGAGKTTFFNIICGLINGYKGSIKLYGNELHAMKRADIAKRLAMVPQKHEPMFPYTVKDFILMGRYPYMGTLGIPSDEDIAVVKEAANETGAIRFFDRAYNTLSGGEMQLSVIARALAQQAELLILDEPSNHLDFKNRFVVLDLISRIAKKNNTSLIMSLHDPNDVLQFADRAVVIDKGVVVADGKPADVINYDLLAGVFGIKTELIEGNGRKFYMPIGIN